MKIAPGRLGLILLGIAVVLLVGFALVVRGLRQPQEFAPGIELAEEGVHLRTTTVYYLAADTLSLAPRERELLVRSSRRALTEDLVGFMTQPAEGVRPALPEDTRLLHVFERDGELVLDFSVGLETMASRSVLEDRLRLTAFLRTLVENLDRLERVRLLVHGRPLEVWGAHIRLEPVIDVEAWL